MKGREGELIGNLCLIPRDLISFVLISWSNELCLVFGQLNGAEFQLQVPKRNNINLCNSKNCQQSSSQTSQLNQPQTNQISPSIHSNQLQPLRKPVAPLHNHSKLSFDSLSNLIKSQKARSHKSMTRKRNV
jgi:hypothetical protein